MKKAISILAILAIPMLGICQRGETRFEMDGLFDNREFKADMQPQTIYAESFSPQIGFSYEGGTIMGGFTKIYEFGSTKENRISPELILYFMYKAENFQSIFGVFPRSMLQKKLPAAFEYDSISYYNPNIQGTLFQYSKDRFQTEFYCNWYSRQTYTDREIFRLVSDGGFNMDSDHTLGAGWYATLTHYAKTKTGIGENLYEKFMAYPYIHLNLQNAVPVLDNLYIDAGVLASSIRNRGLEHFENCVGYLGNIYANYKRIEVRNTTYAGRKQMIYLDDHRAGLLFHQNDPFYNHSFYDRLDMNLVFMKSSTFQGDIGWSLHFTPGQMHNQQVIRIRYCLDSNGHHLNSTL